MLTVQPILKTSYTDRGNEYKKSNIGKTAATVAIGAETGYIAMKGIKEIPFNKVKAFTKAKIQHIDIAKIKNIKNKKFKMPNPKNLLQNMFASIERFAVKAQIKLAKPAEKVAKSHKLKDAFKGAKNFGARVINKAENIASSAVKTLKTPNAIKVSKLLP